MSENARPRHVLGPLAAIISIALGVALLVAPPTAGAVWLPRVFAAAIIINGVLQIATALRGVTDERVASLLNGLIGIALGILALLWPVLALMPLRIGIGIWLISVGALALFWPERASARKKRSEFARWSRTIVAALVLLVTGGAALGSIQLLGGVPLPKPDAFYTPPASVPAEHGKLIRSEPLTTGVPNGAQAFKILYTTTNSDGSPAVASGTVLLPDWVGSGADYAPLPVLTVSHGTTGVVDGCAPSLSATPFADGAGTAMAQLVVDHGWAAVVSDYTGMGTAGTAAYLVGEAEARNVLDASLAARELEGIGLSNDTVIWGHSQGGQGSLWSGQIAGEYAPELTVHGVAAFAPAADLFGLAEADKDNPAGKTVSAYIAATWNELYPELNLEAQLTPGSAGPVEKIAGLCFSGSDAVAAILRGSQVPNQIFPDAVLAGEFGDKLKAQSPTGPWPAPVLVAQGLSDQLVLPRLQVEWVNSTCQAGNVVDFRTYAGRDHVSVVASDSPLTEEIVGWTLERLAGEPGPTECTAQQF